MKTETNVDLAQDVKNFDALFSKYFTKIYRVFNFRTEELRAM